MRAVAFMLLLAVGGCAPLMPVAERYDKRARELNQQREVVQGIGYAHVVYTHPATSTPGPLHVYFEGDGSPWTAETRVADDPTPAVPVALQLMQLDAAASMLVGRPCYHGMSIDKTCTPTIWTHARYSEAVVASMTSVIDQVLRRHGARPIVLIGYSGGAVLAMLVAERLADVAAVITIAGNLDTGAWTRLHGYSSLVGSLNPAERAPLSPAIVQLHLVGERDEKVPPALTELAIVRQPGAVLRRFPDADHACCWEQIWPEVLTELAASTSNHRP